MRARDASCGNGRACYLWRRTAAGDDSHIAGDRTTNPAATAASVTFAPVSAAATTTSKTTRYSHATSAASIAETAATGCRVAKLPGSTSAEIATNSDAPSARAQRSGLTAS